MYLHNAYVAILPSSIRPLHQQCGKRVVAAQHALTHLHAGCGCWRCYHGDARTADDVSLSDVDGSTAAGAVCRDA